MPANETGREGAEVVDEGTAVFELLAGVAHGSVSSSFLVPADDLRSVDML